MTIDSDIAIDYGNVYTVYVLTFPDMKRYVGMTRQDVKKRWRGGSGYKNQQHIYPSIKKYGWNNIKHEVVLEGANLREAGELERQLIEKYKTQDPEYGFNIKPGGDTFNDHSEEFIDALRERMTGNTYCVGRKISEQHIQALHDGLRRAYAAGKRQKKRDYNPSEEQRKHISECAKARWADPEYRQHMKLNRRDTHGEGNPMYGRHHSEETKELIRQRHLGKKLTEEQKKIYVEIHKKDRKPVRQYDMDLNFIKEYPMIKEAAEAVSGNTTNIVFACKNPNRSYKGFKWRYADGCT